MGLRKKLQSFILGNREFVGTHAAFKSVILTGQMALAAYAVGLVFVLIDAANHVKAFTPFYIVLMLVAVIVLALLRYAMYPQAKIVLLLASNLLIYVFASNDTADSGAYIYFLITPLMSLSLFGFNELKVALVFCGLSLALFFLSYMFDFKIIAFSDQELNILIDENYTRISFISNFIIGLFVSVLSFYFLLDINQSSEKKILEKNEELAKTNEELDRFVYSASHDLRAPLRSVLGLIGVANHSKSKEELEECLTMMTNRINSLDKFIGEIIDFSRNSRQELQEISINVLAICNEIVEELKFSQGLEDLSINYNIPSDFRIDTDPTRLKIILSNIIGNAMKYQDNLKEKHQIEISAEKRNGQTEIMVKDNGVGILKEHHSKIFDMFYRASEKSHGSGLGLYIVKETLAKLNGSIRFSSDPETGTIFYITLPC